ncbi:MAG TPA: magnesium transporter CorA family protein [Abditibacterium sp.]|jgi:magnesium transporter
MISILKKTNGALSTIDEPVAGSWVNAVAPDAADIERLQALGVPVSFISAALDEDERARTDKEGGASLIIVRVPFDLGEGADVRYWTVPLGIVLVGELIVTICKFPNTVLDGVLKNRVHVPPTGKRNRLLLFLLQSTAQNYLFYLRRIDTVTDEIESKLKVSLQNEEVLQLLTYQKSLVYFMTGLRSNDLVMQRLQKSQLFQLYPDDLELLDDVLTENTQATEMTGISSNILSQSMDAYASIISNNLNVVMKFLASVTILLTFPTLVASIYGMNVPLPGQTNPQAFWFVMGLSVLLSSIAAAFFWKRRWF